LIYAAAYAAMNELLGYLTENCCQGDAAACGIGVCDPATASQGDRHEAPARAHVR
jgi:hypothetical protein